MALDSSTIKRNAGRVFIDKLLAPLADKGRVRLILLLLLNLISNSAFFIYEIGFNHHYKNPFAILLATIILSCTLAYIETAIAYCFQRYRRLQRIYMGVVVAIYNLLIVVDYFCLYSFQSVFTQNFLDIVRATSVSESTQFLVTYMNARVIIEIVAGMAILNWLLVLLSRWIARIHPLQIAISILGVIGLCYWIYMVIGVVLYRKITYIPESTSPTRFAYYFLTSRNRSNQIHELREACKNLSTSNCFADRPNVVVVIGESASVYHTQLYGYEKATTPRMGNLASKGELIAFDDAIAVEDNTLRVMKSVFSPDSMGVAFSTTPLFPAIFKSCGYTSHCYENEFFVGGYFFLSDTELSGLLFDYRNTEGYQYDGDLISTIRADSIGGLYIVHLWGQHYLYDERYPAEWDIFKAEQYDEKRWNLRQRQIIAHYDNATLYNDYVLEQIIDKFRSTNCVLIYFSDHGQEVFELRDFNGHGTAPQSPDLRYQIRVPMFIWMSDEYRKAHPDIYQQAVANQQTPITTDDVSHTILGLAGIETPWYNPRRDFLHPDYDKTKRRIVLHSIDYDSHIGN